ncbi:MAG: glycosyltransferase family 4 protein [Chloroflexi bacterium]|nr:glycosyltransferase family 4 protein [Chloroflexota bacterium]
MRLLLFNLATDADDPILGFTVLWIRALSKQVESIDIITMRAGRAKLPGNVRVNSVGKEWGHTEARRAVEFYRHLLNILRSHRVDVCFSHMIPIFTILAAPMLKLKGIPIVTWYAHPSSTHILKLAHVFSQRMVTSMATAYPYKHDKLTVVGQGIDTELFSPDGTPPPDDPPIILCAGRLSAVKGHPILLKAASILRKRWDKPFRVVVVGGPAAPQDEVYVRLLIDQVKELGLREIVEFSAPVPMGELPSWYGRCTVHVNLTPSGFGDKVALEAMACGRPCLVANEGFKETLGNYAESLVFHHGDPGDLAEKMQNLLELTSLEHQEIGIYLRNQVIRLHSLKQLAERLVDVFGQVSIA